MKPYTMGQAAHRLAQAGRATVRAADEFDYEEAFETLHRCDRWREELEDALAERMRADGLTWRQIAEVIGVHVTSAHDRYAEALRDRAERREEAAHGAVCAEA